MIGTFFETSKDYDRKSGRIMKRPLVLCALFCTFAGRYEEDFVLARIFCQWPVCAGCRIEGGF